MMLLVINTKEPFMKLLSSEWRHNVTLRCAGGCVVECRIYNREVTGSNLGLGYFAPRSTQPSIPPGSVNEYQLRLGRQRQVWLTPIADERMSVQVKLWDPSRTRAIPERFCGGDSLYEQALYQVYASLPFDSYLLVAANLLRIFQICLCLYEQATVFYSFSCRYSLWCVRKTFQ